ncbi:glycoside hydrolase family 2 protein [Nocardioides flavescens]|uniref:Glycoside hydrolase family 2 protein n=1 Tax=Nocardioides flavescens TaxID=2691959 RepID=A0A6L7EVL2_9ACTN|nr:glycoside hydrolase family 2 protein [Nocardioides flavescens]MXG88235.1 glycoside hydrolase family 2 protein [Nocardioides flavescens]
MTRSVLSFTRLTPEPGPDADEVEHVFVARVEAPEDGVLEVEGIATVWDLLVDGEVAASGRSQFERHEVPVGAGAHEVRIVVHPLAPVLDETARKPRQRWRTMLVEDARLRWVRTQLLGRAPGFSPGPPVVGPHLPVTLVTGPRPPRVVRTWLDGTTGVVELSDGRSVRVPDAQPWWPHTHGTPHLHDVEVDGHVLRVGFRTVENRSTDSLDLWVNGVRVFARGAVWTPGPLDALDEAVALGLNLVRVPGIAAYESEAFHARCDELGLLVWQDLMFATFDYPLADPGFAATVEGEVRVVTALLARHPSTAVVCGSAEHEQQAAMFGVSPSTGAARELAALLALLVRGSATDAVWVDSSPSGGDPVIRVDTGIAQYFGVGAYLRALPDARHSRVGFAAECLAFSNLPAPDSPADVRGGVPQDNGADWDFADVREHYLRERYGADATPDGDEARRVTGEVMADVFGEWRRPGSGCGGGIVLWLRDVQPGAGWGLLDSTGRPKPAALALAPVLQPTAVWVVDEGLNGLDVHVAHDGPAPLEATLEVELLRPDGSVGETCAAEVSLPAHGHASYGVEALLGRFADVSYAYRFGPPQHAGVRARLSAPDLGLERTATWLIPLAARQL